MQSRIKTNLNKLDYLTYLVGPIKPFWCCCKARVVFAAPFAAGWNLESVQAAVCAFKCSLSTCLFVLDYAGASLSVAALGQSQW